jgi:hypothetical protein
MYQTNRDNTVDKIIFLDIDGVLNNARYASLLNHLYGNNGYGGFDAKKLTVKTIKWDPYNVGALKTLMDKTRAKIVISSTWRYTHTVNNFKDMFQLYGLNAGRIIALTPDFRGGGIYDTYSSNFRGDEVNRYISDNDIQRYVILDDGTDFYPGQNLVLTDDEYGLTDSDMLKAIRILNGV